MKVNDRAKVYINNGDGTSRPKRRCYLQRCKKLLNITAHCVVILMKEYLYVVVMHPIQLALVNIFLLVMLVNNF